MTNKLYFSNPYLKTWNTVIEKTIEKDGKYHILLGETIFFPEGGGQPCDQGFIDDIEVIDVYENDDLVFHVLPSAPTKDIVTCTLDFDRRFDHMQQHAGEHLLSAVFLHLFNGHNLGFHLGDDCVTIDISLDSISASMVLEAENAANEIIFKNLDIKTYILDSNTAKKLPLRKTPIEAQSLRIVEIDRFDYSACCGTHVGRTGEIGIIKILKTQKYKGMTRIYFKCGKRALNDFQFKHDLLAGLASRLSTGEEHLASKIENDLSELKDKSRELKALKEKLNSYEAQDMINSSNSNLIADSYEDRDFSDIDSLARQILKIGNYIVILSSLKDKKLLACYSGSFEINLGKIFKENAPHFHGKGGGNDKQAQCSFNEIGELLNFEKFLKESIKKAILCI